MLAGFHHDNGPAELKARYHDHAGYMQEVDKATQEALKAGFILPYDAEQIRRIPCERIECVPAESGENVNTDRHVEGDIEIHELRRTWAPRGMALRTERTREGEAEPVVA